jgi:predicted phage terminase large subunit-like protein
MATDTGMGCEGTTSHWQTTNGASLLATGIEGALTGYGIDGAIIVDDPVKDRMGAESATMRDHACEWFHDVAMTRVHPGASVLVVQTRWHPDDLAGRLIADGWHFINLAAIAEEDEPTRKAGEALWPARRPIDFLEKIRSANAYTWASLYQGRPRPKGGAVFGDPRFYERLPETGLRYSIGIDLAYTAKTSSDYSVAVVMAERAGTIYIVDVLREQVSQPTFSRLLKSLCATYPGARVRGYLAGTERGAADYIIESGVKFDAVTAKGDKFVRAQPYAGAWNQDPGRVLVPRQAEWLDAYLNEHARFTGLNDAHDDQVDAAAAAFDALSTPTAKPRVGGQRSPVGDW